MKFLNVIKEENKTIITFINGKIFDEASISNLGLELLSHADESANDSTVILDFVGVDYLSSAALGKIITMNKKLKEKNATFILRNLSENIREVFQITRLDKFLRIE